MHAKVAAPVVAVVLVGAGLFTYVAGNLDSGSFQLSHETCSITDCRRKRQNKEKQKQNEKLINPGCIGTAPAPQRCEQAEPMLAFLSPPSNTHSRDHSVRRMG